ncbi:O-antigen translocase [Flavobacterium rakeshii]|uniref:O-antigen translocase n=1 Tax=Flavobacterium rakeshii TaxID=1038845 RepID=UPI002E7C442B|nr:O-antigen translocase [Flavobacterium rakeshii]MEE1898990.1 O-antigen translocase [Flavobacterium rakeshii]
MKLINTIKGNPVLKVFSLNSLSVGVRLAGGVITSKIIAQFLGPAGLALIGNLRNVLSITDSVSTLGFQNGIVKYIAQHQKNETKLKEILSTVFFILLGVVAILSIAVFFGAGYFSEVFFKDTAYKWVFKMIAFAMPWYAGNIFLISVLNGLGNYKKVIKVNILGNICAVLLSAILIIYHQLNGALIAVALSPALLLIFSFIMLRREISLTIFIRRSFFRAIMLKNLFYYSLMTLVTVVTGSLVTLYIRNLIIDLYGETQGGYWEAVNRFSSYYLMFITTLLTVYFLPKLSAAITNKETKTVFHSYYKTVIPLFGVGLFLIFVLKYVIIKVLLSDEFLPVGSLFKWQLAGDFLKACSIILGYEFFAKKMTKAFIATEVFSFVTLYLSATYFIKQYGAEGAVMAHAFTYALYLLLLLMIFRKKLI